MESLTKNQFDDVFEYKTAENVMNVFLKIYQTNGIKPLAFWSDNGKENTGQLIAKYLEENNIFQRRYQEIRKVMAKSKDFGQNSKSGLRTVNHGVKSTVKLKNLSKHIIFQFHILHLKKVMMDLIKLQQKFILMKVYKLKIYIQQI